MSSPAKSSLSVVRHPLVLRVLQVAKVVRPTPRVVRITLGGPDLAGFVTLSPEDHVKVFFPAPGETEPVLPDLGPDGIRKRDPGAPAPIARDYTPRRHDAVSGELEIDFFLHGDGVAARWADQAKPGLRLGVAGPRGSHVLTETFDWYLLVGDETALPAIARRLEEFPAGTRAVAVVQVSGGAERQILPEREGYQVVWVECAPENRATSGALAAAVAGLALPEGRGFAWVASEVEETRSVYRHLLNERKLPKEQVHVSGHWRRGVANHDHHAPIEA